MDTNRAPRRPRKLTGRHVLLGLVAFFGVVFAVNAVLVRAAISTFGGVETVSS
jgi:nitrogen fixation protein FixH